VGPPRATAGGPPTALSGLRFRMRFLRPLCPGNPGAAVDRAITALREQHPLAEERMSMEEQHRRWGQEILDALDRA
jgi:hypothetical protein